MEDMNDMREFEQRMLQRAVRRRMLLSTVATTPPPTPPPSPPPPSELQSVEPQQLSPQRQSRRARLALLSGRINEFLKEEVSTVQDGKSIESKSKFVTSENTDQAVRLTNDLAKKKIIKTNANTTTLKESISNNEPPVSSVADKSLLGLKVSVAQRRALFESNIVAPVPYKTPSIVSIVTKTTATTAVSPADRIAMSVERVHIKSPPPCGRLYPDLSFVEESKDETNANTNQLENLVSGYKRRSDGSSIMNTSTTSSESVSKDDDNTEFVGAKRTRSELSMIDTDQVKETANQEGISPRLAATISNNQSCDLSSSMLSDFTADSPMTQASTSFLYYGVNGNHAVAEYLEARSTLPSDDMEITNETPCKGSRSSIKQASNDHNAKSYLELNDIQSVDKSTNYGNVKPALLHTVSTYRKQQQQLRLSGTSCKNGLSEFNGIEGKNTHSLLNHELQRLNEDDEDDEDNKLQELEMVAARARDLERIVVPEQDRIIEQATQALNICDVYRQKSGNRPTNHFSPEHVHAERLLLIAGLKRTDAVREAQRLRVEHTLLPGRTTDNRFDHLNVCGEGKTLVIESLRVPLLSALISGGNKTKYTSNEGTENLTRWPGGYRYFVCVIRAAATAYRPPMTSATRPVDTVEESMSRFSSDSVHCGNDGIGYGYVEFITKKQIKNSNSRKCPMPTESEGAPIMIKGLDSGGWKITVELYGLCPTTIGENNHHNTYNNSKEHDGPENNKSVLDKLWSTVTTPSKESKKNYTTPTACIESPGGPMAVRNTVFRQLGYFVFSDGQVDRQQFTLNKVHQSGGSSIGSRGINITPTEETVRIHMRLLEDGEQYIYEDEEGEINLDHMSLGNNKYAGNNCLAVAAKKPLTIPSCKRMEGFLTLFDDHELRATPIFGHGQWQHRLNIGSGSSNGTTSWRRLWFRIEVVSNTEQKISNNDGDSSLKQQQLNDRKLWPQTIVLRYWMYPEHVEQEREPLGAIDLSLCLPKVSLKMATSASDSKFEQQPLPAAPAPTDLCARPNTLRLLFCRTIDNDNEDNVEDPLLLAADTADERREWCDTVNAAVHAIGEYQERIRVAEEAQLKQKEQIQQKRRLQEQQRTGAWPTTPSSSGKNYCKKKKFYK